MINQLFLRKVKLFNKNRYSRNRQLARVIFYFALYINILVIFGIFFVFYGLSFETDLYYLFLLAELLLVGAVFLVNGMFTFFFNHFYKTLKSGLLLDFFFKKTFVNISKSLFLLVNIYFSEKFFIEYNYYKIKNLLNFVNKYLDLFKNEAVYSIISVSVIMFILILIFLFNG